MTLEPRKCIEEVSSLSGEYYHQFNDNEKSINNNNVSPYPQEEKKYNPENQEVNQNKEEDKDKNFKVRFMSSPQGDDDNTTVNPRTKSSK